MGLPSAAHVRGLRIWLAYGELVLNNIIITLRVVKSTPVALVKLRGAQLNQARWAWLNHFAAQSGGGKKNPPCSVYLPARGMEKKRGSA